MFERINWELLTRFPQLLPYNSLDEFTEPELMEAWAHILQDKGNYMCGHCGAICDGVYCQKCGQPLLGNEGHECADCAITYYGDVFFCKHCGKKIAVDEFERRVMNGEGAAELMKNIIPLTPEEIAKIFATVEREGFIQL